MAPPYVLDSSATDYLLVFCPGDTKVYIGSLTNTGLSTPNLVWDNTVNVWTSLVRHDARTLTGHRDIVSGAGHDAGYISRVAPVGMVFVPCADGISHNEVESAEPADLAAGCNVLLRAMLRHAAAG